MYVCIVQNLIQVLIILAKVGKSKKKKKKELKYCLLFVANTSPSYWKPMVPSQARARDMPQIPTSSFLKSW